MSDQDKNDFKSDIDVIKKDLVKIRKSLARIKKRQDDDRKGSEQQFLIGLGFACVVVGSTFLITTSNFGGGIGIILAGIGVVLAAYFGKPFRKR